MLAAGAPVEEGCTCYTCSTFSRAYLRHLYERKEITSAVLNTIHNLYFYQELMRGIRAAIAAGRYAGFRDDFVRRGV